MRIAKRLILALIVVVLAWLTYTSVRDCPTGSWIASGAGAYKCDGYPKAP